MTEDYTKPIRNNLIICNNVNNALPQGIALLRHFGRKAAPRGKAVLEMDQPIITKYLRPEQCVLIDDTRLCNPFFHLIEALWILNGRSNVSTLKFYNAKMADYSDDGETFHGAYGYRLRGSQYNPNSMFADGFGGFEQLRGVMEKLRQDPMSRQAVALIWNREDLWAKSKDIPCNDMLMFTLRDGRLDMTIVCRSNDIIWGAYGANAVQFSFILQYVAAGLGVKVGYMHQFSNNYHAYTEEESAPLWNKLSTDQWIMSGSHKKAPDGTPTASGHDPYVHMGIRNHPLIDYGPYTPEESTRNFDKEVDLFLKLVDEEIALFEDNQISAMSSMEFYNPNVFTQPFIRNVALPMHIVWLSRKLRKCSRHMSEELYGQLTTSPLFDMKIDWLAAAVHWCNCMDERPMP